MDRDQCCFVVSPDAAASTRIAEYAALHAWLTEHALESATTAEAELTIDWRRHCDRLRHEQPRPHIVRPGAAGPAPQPRPYPGEQPQAGAR